MRYRTVSASLVNDLDGLCPAVDEEDSVIQLLQHRVVIRIQTSGSNDCLLFLVRSRVFLHGDLSFLIGARPIRTALPRAKDSQKTVGATCCAVLPPDMAQPAGGLSLLSAMVSKKVDIQWLRMRPRSWWNMPDSNRRPPDPKSGALPTGLMLHIAAE